MRKQESGMSFMTIFYAYLSLKETGVMIDKTPVSLYN